MSKVRSAYQEFLLQYKGKKNSTPESRGRDWQAYKRTHNVQKVSRGPRAARYPVAAAGYAAAAPQMAIGFGTAGPQKATKKGLCATAWNGQAYTCVSQKTGLPRKSPGTKPPKGSSGRVETSWQTLIKYLVGQAKQQGNDS